MNSEYPSVDTCRLAGAARPEALWWPRLMRSLGPSVIPAFPGADVIPPAVMPAPPLLEAGAPINVRAHACGRAYSGAATARYRRRNGTFARFSAADIVTSPHYGTLCDAAEVMVEKKIAPIAWCAFSIDAWRKYVPSANPKLPPPPGWVFAMKRLDERVDWFADEESAYRGGRMVVSKPQHELMGRYRRMRSAILAEAPKNEAMVMVIVSRFCDADTYARLVSEARAVNREQEERWADAVTRGRFIW